MGTRRNAPAPDVATEAAVPGLAPRGVAHRVVAELLGAGQTQSLDDALAQAISRARLEPAEALLARAIATATFRRLGFLRAALAERMPKGLPEDQPRLVALLATGAAQVLDLAVADHAAVDLSVRLAKADPGLAHAAGLVNAVLRRLTRESAQIAAAEADPLARNTPDWLARRWRAHYGEATARAIAVAHLAGAALDLTVREDRAGWAERLGGTLMPLGSVRLTEVRALVQALPGYVEGAWWVQDAAAALPARLLDVQPGERVADLCAAPGGKTAQLAAAGATVTAVDRSSKRLDRLRDNLARLGLTAEVHAGDALDLPGEATFDAILLDAPCTATGTIRRRPDVAWTKREADIPRLADLQARLLDAGARLLRPGGRLVYCTCSLEPEEGEAQAAAFLARHPNFAPLPIAPHEVAGQTTLIDGSGNLRTTPCSLDPAPTRASGLDGFFAARFTRRT